ncbi:MAG TPA: hypothetical protein VGH14_07425 [Solirubrobacterales bacterium]
MLGRTAPRLRERLAEATGWDERFAIFAEEMELGRTDAPPPGTLRGPRPEVVEAWRLLSASRGRIRIEEIAERVFLRPVDRDYGSRDVIARDPEGNIWSFGTYPGAPRKA